jgi:hypothetical protein
MRCVSAGFWQAIGVRLIASLPLSLLVGLGVGYVAFHEPAPNTAAVGAARHVQERSADAADIPDLPEATDKKMQRLIAATQSKGSRMTRENAMYVAIEALTGEDLRGLMADGGALKAMVDKGGGNLSNEFASALIGHWLAVAPEAVLAWMPQALESIPAEHSHRGIILDALAAKLPVQMLALVPSRKNASKREEIISRALLELAANDLSKARAWLALCTDPEDRKVAEKAVRFGTVRADPTQAVELAGSMEDRQQADRLFFAATERAAKMSPGVMRQLAAAPLQPWMIPYMLFRLGQHDPELAVDLALKSAASGMGGSDDLHGAFAALARKDPAQAIVKMEGLTGPQLTAAVSAIGLEWAASDPAAALAWLVERPASERRGLATGPNNGESDALVVAFGEWVGNGSDAARAWAEALPAGETRIAVQTKLAQVLAERGLVAEATQLLARLGSAADPKAVSNIAASWAKTDPQAAANWVISQPPGQSQNGALSSVVWTWASENPHGVEDWLAQFPSGEARDQSVASFLARDGSWAHGSAERSAEFERWFDLIENPKQRTHAAIASFWRRRESDPIGARAWLSTLPNVDSDVIRMAIRNSRR